MSTTADNITSRRRFVAKILARAARYKMRGDEVGMICVVADGFLRLGGVYVKFLQGVLLQLPLMRDWKNDKRYDVYENVPTQELDIVAVLRASLRNCPIDMIATVALEPFAAGSFGQVYRATLKSGQKVVIKVLRPGAAKTLAVDLKLIRMVVRILVPALSNININIKSLTREFMASTRAEIDYLGEARFADEMYSIYRDSKLIVIPRTYLEICTPHVIVQDFVGGVSVAQLLRDPSIKDYAREVYRATGSNLETQLTRLGFELYVASLSGKSLHGDPHPGNIRLLPDDKVGLLDFGIRGFPSVSPRSYYLMLKEWWRAEYLNEPDPGAMFVSYIRLYSERLFQSMKIISEHTSKKLGQTIKLDSLIAEFSNRIFSQKVSRQDLQSGLEDIRRGKGAGDISVINVVNTNNRFRLIAHIQDGPLMRSLVTYISLVTELGYREVIPNIYESVMRHVDLHLPHLEQETPFTLSLNEAMETLCAWLAEVASYDVELYRHIVGHLQGDGVLAQ